jgi:hypothetical protein
MTHKFFKRFVVFGLVFLTAMISIGCTVQWAMKNKNTDCGFTNDNIQPNGRKDPMTFYSDPRSNN